MQNMVQIRKKNTYFVTKWLFTFLGKSSFGGEGVAKEKGGYGPTVAPRNDSPKGSQKEENKKWVNMPQSKS